MAIYKEPFATTDRGDNFGNLAEYRHGRPHRGQDWSPKSGLTIPAITDGVVNASTEANITMTDSTIAPNTTFIVDLNITATA